MVVVQLVVIVVVLVVLVVIVVLLPCTSGLMCIVLPSLLVLIGEAGLLPVLIINYTSVNLVISRTY